MGKDCKWFMKAYSIWHIHMFSFYIILSWQFVPSHTCQYIYVGPALYNHDILSLQYYHCMNAWRYWITYKKIKSSVLQRIDKKLCRQEQFNAGGILRTWRNHRPTQSHCHIFHTPQCTPRAVCSGETQQAVSALLIMDYSAQPGRRNISYGTILRLTRNVIQLTQSNITQHLYCVIM